MLNPEVGALLGRMYYNNITNPLETNLEYVL